MSVDDFAFALDAMNQVLAAMREQPKAKSGSGTLTCPKCQGALRFTFTRGPGRGRHRQSYSAACSTVGCIQFAGH